MCFDVDSDWSASVCETTDPVTEKAFRCEECRETVQVGESFRQIFMQERETCYACDEGECDCVDWDADDVPLDHKCRCEKPSYGEQYTYRSCQNCCKFLEAVEKHERDEGCGPDESRPGLGDMIESMAYFDDDQLAGYFAEAEKMHPDLRASGYLDRLMGKLRAAT
jgi:hypothetical protein